MLLDQKDCKEHVEIQDSVALLVTLDQLALLASEVLPVSSDLVVSLAVLGHKVKLDQWDCLECKALVEQQVHLVLQDHRDCLGSLENEDQ